MSDQIRESYENTPYRQSAFPRLHPARLGAIATLHGMSPQTPESCRVLELGCGEGMNLLPLAERFPQSEFLGIDFSSTQIAVAEKARVAAGLENIKFLCGDMMQYSPPAASFDYVIAQGIYSWVPDPVKDRVLALVRHALKPGGIACVSYNILPGWNEWMPIRQVILRDLSGETDPEKRLHKGVVAIRAMEECLKEKTDSTSVMMREELVKRLDKKPVAFYHDELDLVNDPVTFIDFNDHISRHGLKYVADAQYGADVPEVLPLEQRQALGAVTADRIGMQQLMDMLRYRSFRSSILCHAQELISQSTSVDPLRDFAITLKLQATVVSPDLREGIMVRFRSQEGNEMGIDRAFDKAALSFLATRFPARIPFLDVIQAAKTRLDAAGIPYTHEAEQKFRLLSLGYFFAEYMDFLYTGRDKSWVTEGSNPHGTALARHQAAEGLSVVNRWHESIALDAPTRAWLAAGAEHSPMHALRIEELKRLAILW